MRIAVTTPEGHVGSHLTRMLIRGGIRPVLLTRHPERLSDTYGDLAEVAHADLLDRDQVITATAGVDALHWVDPSPTGPDPLAELDLATAAVCAAVSTHRIPRVVFQSSVGAERRHGMGEIDGLAATESALDALIEQEGGDRLPAVLHLRCGYFMTNLLLDLESVRTGRLQTVLSPDAPMAWVAPRDIAEVAGTALVGPGWSGRRVQAVHGPEDLTWRQVGDLLGEILARPVTVEQITDDAMRAQLRSAGLGSAQVEAILGMSTGQRDFEPEQPRSMVSTTPTSLRSWIHDALVPLI